MTAPEGARSWMDDDPKIEGLAMLILDRLSPALHHAVDYGKQSYPDLDEGTLWMNGAIFGAVATFITIKHPDPQLEEITKLYACISEVINHMFARYGRFDLDQYAQDLLVRVGAEEEADHV